MAFPSAPAPACSRLRRPSRTRGIAYICEQCDPVRHRPRACARSSAGRLFKTPPLRPGKLQLYEWCKRRYYKACASQKGGIKSERKNKERQLTVDFLLYFISPFSVSIAGIYKDYPVDFTRRRYLEVFAIGHKRRAKQRLTP